MNLTPKMIIAVDPGGTTGITRWLGPELQRPGRPEWTQIEIGPCSDAANLKKVMTCLSGHAIAAEPFGPGVMPITIILEPFEFRKDDQNRDKIDYIAGEVVGVVKLWAFERSYVHLVMQGASYGVEGFWSDEKVKQIGLWRPGMRHAMDATKHILMYRTFKLDDQSLLMLLR